MKSKYIRQKSSKRYSPAFAAELEKRIAEMESGKVKTYSWDEVSTGLKRNIAGLEDVMS